MIEMILQCMIIVVILLFLISSVAVANEKSNLLKLKRSKTKRKLVTNQNDNKFSGRTLELSGSGEVMLTPDICVLSVTIESKDKKSAFSAHSSSQKVAKSLFTQLSNEGIDTSDIATMNMQLNPMYVYVHGTGTQTFDGFSSRQDVVIKVRNIPTVANILDIIANMETIQINNVAYNVENTKPYLENVRVEAFKNLLLKAEHMCKLAGVKLGKPISISEDTNDGNRFQNRAYMADSKMMAMSSPAGGTGVNGGEVKLTHSVHATFELIV